MRLGLRKQIMFFGGSRKDSNGGGGGVGGWGGVNDVRCGLLTKVIMSCYEDKHCSTRHTRASCEKR